MSQDIKYRLITLIVIIFPSFCFAGDVYQSLFCSKEEAVQLASDFGLGISQNIEPVVFSVYNECLDGNLYKKTGDNYEFYYPDQSRVCDDLCNDWLKGFSCTFDSCEPDDPPTDTVDPVYIHLAGLAGCLLGFLFGLAFILGSYIH